MREVVMKNKRAAHTLRDASARTPWLSVSLGGFERHPVAPEEGLLAVGDAASFIDPFTGSGMLMALESGQLVAEIIARHLPHLRNDVSRLSHEYRVAYSNTFESRLRTAGLLRRAAFVPGLAGAAIRLSSISSRLRRELARATHQSSTHSIDATSIR
jgi:flavin-dependent dehydrogenase